MALGDPWTLSKAKPITNDGSPLTIPLNTFESPDHQYFQGPGAERLELRFTFRSKLQRLTICGCYPATGRDIFLPPLPGMLRPEITVGISRGPEAIAKEIIRRLLPEYRRVLAAEQEIKQRTDALANRQETNLRSVAEALGATASAANVKRGAMTIHLPLSDTWADLEVSGSSVNLNLRSLSPTTALELARLPKESQGRKE